MLQIRAERGINRREALGRPTSLWSTRGSSWIWRSR